MAAAIIKLIGGRGAKTTNVWIGTPGITSLNFNSGITISTLTSYLSNVYTIVVNTVPAYRSNIAGAYMNQEGIYCGVDCAVSSTNTLANILKNLANDAQVQTQVKRMSDLRTWVNSR